MARLAYLGTPQVAVQPLEALIAEGHDIALVVSQPDKRRGRGSDLQPSPVKAVAINAGIPVSDSVDDLLNIEVDLGVVVAYGRLIKPHILERIPMVNLHFSLLPRWRGAAPVERAILEGDHETGVCLMALEEGLDTGPIYECKSVEIGEEENVEQLRNRLVDIGTEMLLRNLRHGLGEPTPQVGNPSVARKIDTSELNLDWNEPAEQISRRIRLGRARTFFRGKRLLILRADHGYPMDDLSLAPGELRVIGSGLYVGGGDGRTLRLFEVQPEGKPPQLVKEWRNGARLEEGERFASS